MVISAQLKAGTTSPPTTDSTAFRDAMARFPSGVTIVTTHDDSGTPHGFTASSFCSVSAEPPLVLVCLARSANSYPVFVRSNRFAISILQADHVEVARRFASKNTEKFACGEFARTASGATVLETASAVVECSVYRRYEAGDHMIMVGAVEHVSLTDVRAPVVYFDREFNTICSTLCNSHIA
ncbi:MAG: flavin reductase family protein [Pseudonocardia sp.]